MPNSFTYGFYDELEKLAAIQAAALLPVLGRTAAQVAGGLLLNKAMSGGNSATPQKPVKPVGEMH